MALDLFANFERSSNGPVFYRQINTVPSLCSFVFKISDLQGFDPLATYNADYCINNGTYSSFTNLTTSVNILVNKFPEISSFTARVTSVFLSLTTVDFFTLSAVFVSSYISASPFIVYPGEYFNTSLSRATITPANLSSSPGVSFYGEGHTENIYLSTQPGPNITQFVWKFGDYTDLYTPFVSGATPKLSSAVVAISSSIGFYPRIPVELQACNSVFISSAPTIFFNDETGIPEKYPFVRSTIDALGNELSTSRFFQSIVIKPYDPPQYVFDPGIPSTVYLPINGAPIIYTASLNVQLSAGIPSVDPCFQKYGIAWKWSTFENCQTFTNYPSSWASTQCLTGTPGKFGKKWGYELPLSADLFNTNPIFYTGSTTNWSLCSEYWTGDTFPKQNEPLINPAITNYTLQLSANGSVANTASYFSDTPLTLKVNKQVIGKINVPSYGQPSDWLLKTTTINEQHDILSLSPPDIKLYTSNRFVLTGSNVIFENLTTKTNLLCSLTIDFDDNLPPVTLTGENIKQNFIKTYNIPGIKNIKIVGTPTYDVTPIVLTLPQIIEVVTQYDNAITDSYISTKTPLSLPFPNKIQIAANDWAVADVYNSCIQKFYKNLEYLNTRGTIYNGTYSDYFGWLGPQPLVVNNLSSCGQYTWEDTNCVITPENYITWIDMLSGASWFNTNYVGRLANCGTWQQQNCITQKVSPDCTGLYCVPWQWKARKCANTDIAISWKQTKSNGVYVKRWYFEPCQTTSIIVCNEGVWNVNIPKLNTFYDPIGNCNIQRSCTYNGVVSRDNILYIAQKTQLKLLSSDYTATFFNAKKFFDNITPFVNIKNVSINSEGKIIVLDSDLSQIAVYNLIDNTWSTFNTWGGVGTANAKNKFLNPNDIHVDQHDNIWVTDTGNQTIKVYSSSGAWLRTIQNEKLKNDIPISTCIDSQNNIHVLTNSNIQVYTNTGEFLFTYDYKTYVDAAGVRINTSYNREIIYVCTSTQVIKFFRTGTFNGYIIQAKDCVDNITSIFQDEFRNVLITTNDKILKFPDLMTPQLIKGSLPDYYWKLEDLYIHPEEYIQNWVYNKSLQRLWDCIEIFRSTLLYSVTNNVCKQYKSPTYQKDKIVIGQNEIVTSTVINRCLGYLWENFSSLIDFFDPSCSD